MILSERVDGSLAQREVGDKSFERTGDVIVAGLGTAGAVALIAAARQGLRVLGIERLSYMGGTGTGGGVWGNYFGSEGGLYEDVDAETANLIGDEYTPSSGIHPEAKKYALEKAAAACGAELCYETTVCAVYLDGKTVKGLRWIGPDGIGEAGARTVIDCTGDGEVCALAGCDFALGRAFDGQPQPYSNVRVSAGKRLASGRSDSGYMDPTDAADLSEAVLRSNLEHLKDRYDGGQRLLYVAPQLGIREGRLAVGEETVSLADFLSDRVTSEPVFYAYSNVDSHSKDYAFEDEPMQDWIIGAGLWGVNFSIPIPLGALIPRGFDGLLAAGRCLAVDHGLAACVRMKRDAQKSGEAAALAAYLAIKNGVRLKDVPYGELTPLLKASGCLDEANNRGVVTLKSKDPATHRQVRWLTDPEAIREGLASPRPGIAIWSARRQGESLLPHLLGWLRSRDENLRKHSAFALALFGRQEAAPVLRGMVVHGDNTIAQTSRKSNPVRGHAAVYLLGRLRDREAVPALVDILLGRNPTTRQQLETIEDDGPNVTADYEVCFQYFSHAMIALFKIGDRYADTRQSIAPVLLEAVTRPDFSQVFHLKYGAKYRYDITNLIRIYVARQLNAWAVPHGIYDQLGRETLTAREQRLLGQDGEIVD